MSADTAAPLPEPLLPDYRDADRYLPAEDPEAMLLPSGASDPAWVRWVRRLVERLGRPVAPMRSVLAALPSDVGLRAALVLGVACVLGMLGLVATGPVGSPSVNLALRAAEIPGHAEVDYHPGPSAPGAAGDPVEEIPVPPGAPAIAPLPVEGLDGLIWAVTDPVITSPFGVRYHPVLHEERLHAGIDLGSACGTPVYASEAGTVVLAQYRGASGNAVEIAHGDLNGDADGTAFMTHYFHLEAFGVREGDVVTKGQFIGLVGSTGRSTGCHLHFAISVDGTYVDPEPILAGADPSTWKYAGAGQTREGTVPADEEARQKQAAADDEGARPVDSPGGPPASPGPDNAAPGGPQPPAESPSPVAPPVAPSASPENRTASPQAPATSEEPSNPASPSTAPPANPPVESPTVQPEGPSAPSQSTTPPTASPPVSTEPPSPGPTCPASPSAPAPTESPTPTDTSSPDPTATAPTATGQECETPENDEPPASPGG